jgi:uncharacterized membrane protein YeaQ/YmgE (transglycosylase-associated protein family)
LVAGGFITMIIVGLFLGLTGRNCESNDIGCAIFLAFFIVCVGAPLGVLLGGFFGYRTRLSKIWQWIFLIGDLLVLPFYIIYFLQFLPV